MRMWSNTTKHSGMDPVLRRVIRLRLNSKKTNDRLISTDRPDVIRPQIQFDRSFAKPLTFKMNHFSCTVYKGVETFTIFSNIIFFIMSAISVKWL